jgi:NTP pyrophosphatase (non-canonical NTP hydrolase)
MEGTFMWFMEEVGELSAALRGGSHQERVYEFADVLAWLATLANIAGVNLDEAMRAKYGAGCPTCGKAPCICGDANKP